MFLISFITDIKSDEAKPSEAHHVDERTLRMEDSPNLAVLRGVTSFNRELKQARF